MSPGRAEFLLLALLLACDDGKPDPVDSDTAAEEDSDTASEENSDTAEGEDSAIEYIPCSDEPYVDVESGWYSGCARRADGCLDCWSGPKDTGWWSDHALESPPEGPFVSVSMSKGYAPNDPCAHGPQEQRPEAGACALTANGELACWGKWSSPPPAATWRQVSVGFSHGCGITTDGATLCWGDCEYGECDVPDTMFTSVVAAQNYSCGLREDGSLECWGADPDLNCQCASDEDCWEDRNAWFEPWSAGPFDGLAASLTVLCGRQGSTLSCVEYYDYYFDDTPVVVTMPDDVTTPMMLDRFVGAFGISATGTFEWVQINDGYDDLSVPFQGGTWVDASDGSGLCAVSLEGTLTCAYFWDYNVYCPFCDETWYARPE